MAEISALPKSQQLDALLQYFSTVLSELPLATLRRRRTALIERFSHCGCGFDTSSALLELVDLHVATRERQANRRESARRASAGSGATPLTLSERLRIASPSQPGRDRPDRR